MIIETDNLRIRSITFGDEIVFAEMAKDGSLYDVGFNEGCESWIGEWIKDAIALSVADNPKKEYIACTVCLKESDEIIGSVGCSYYEDLDEVGITYFVGQQYRGNGYAAESVAAYTNYFFNHYSIDKMIATIREANPASWKTVEKCAYKLMETKMYQDINDDEPQLYRFYEFRK